MGVSRHLDPKFQISVTGQLGHEGIHCTQRNYLLLCNLVFETIHNNKEKTTRNNEKGELKINILHHDQCKEEVM